MFVFRRADVWRRRGRVWKLSENWIVEKKEAMATTTKTKTLERALLQQISRRFVTALSGGGLFGKTQLTFWCNDVKKRPPKRLSEVWNICGVIGVSRKRR